MYRPGRYHPVNFGDRSKDGRYRVIRKLGYGSFSTAWLARDEKYSLPFLMFSRNILESETSKFRSISLSANPSGRTKTYVALKIMIAQSSVTETESTMFQTIARSKLSHPGRAHVMSLLDLFKHEGPNGEHSCLVFEPMSSSIASMFEDLPESLSLLKDLPQSSLEFCKSGQTERYQGRFPISMTKSILRQMLLGLDFLHQIGIVHDDLHHGNILISATDLRLVEVSHLSQEVSHPTSFVPIERKDGKFDRWAPKYLVENQPLKGYADLDPNFVVKISDMGTGTLLIPLCRFILY